MESICPIDTKWASEISALLTPPSPLQVQEYFDELLSQRSCNGIKVKLDGQFGKGIYADMDFKEDELVFKDQMLVGIQHYYNKVHCLVCSFCFQFLRSVEYQIGRKLWLKSQGVPTSNECHHGECCSSSSNDEVGECDSSSSDDEVCLPEGVVESLMNEELVVPYSNKFPLPSSILCSRGCGDAHYCSKSCAEADWEASHSLLCTGDRSESPSREALSNFVEHANERNDLFLLAAKTIAFTILRYRKLKADRVKEQDKNIPAASSCCDLSLLLEAWKPISMGHKRRWWDYASFPGESGDVNCDDTTESRMHLRDLAFESLQLLKAAIFYKECEPLFSLEIYGNIIGMFEQNNLDLVVASPVENYFLYIDELPLPEKKKTQEILQPLRSALGDGYSVCCRGNAFYPLQSCLNHSCLPNAKAFKRDEEDKDGQAIIVALRPICKGEEVTISYVDEDLSYEERQEALADYGFICRCAKCLDEES